MMNENPVTTFDRLTKYFEPESDAYTGFYDAQDNFSSPFYKNVATCVVGKPMTVEESGNTYRVEIEYLFTWVECSWRQLEEKELEDLPDRVGVVINVPKEEVALINPSLERVKTAALSYREGSVHDLYSNV
jgi:hypothetical protein